MIDPKKGDAYQGHKKTNPARKARLHPGRSSPAKQLGIPQKLRIPKNFLVGGLEPWNFMTFHSVGNVIIPTDFNIFQRGRLNHQPILNPPGPISAQEPRRSTEISLWAQPKSSAENGGVSQQKKNGGLRDAALILVVWPLINGNDHDISWYHANNYKAMIRPSSWGIWSMNVV